ncbi:MAG: hypothetical protein KME64_21125 [Scytonematopsis contorta HA4267-MV1]|jgi:hypothetical protein|nr:hypothetical protein [Scytonematopsis contorta HA4267-MV1]
MEINGDNYKICGDNQLATVDFIGSLRLSGTEEYAPILKLLHEVASLEPSNITLNLKQLNFLNSSGISMLSKFVIEMRKKSTVKMIVIGSNDIPWQGKSLKNLQRLMPGLTLELH